MVRNKRDKDAARAPVRLDFDARKLAALLRTAQGIAARGKGLRLVLEGAEPEERDLLVRRLAKSTGLKVRRIDLSEVLAEGIEEAHRVLKVAFAPARPAEFILFFDEADALFGKRSEVRDSHDRYANIEISYLLQKMEEYEGMAILATNLRQNLDEAFIRRLAFTVHFSFPDAVRRRLIWDRIWPPEIPLADDVDFDRLAQQYKLSGGNVKNVALAAAFLAAAEQRPVSMLHLIQAVRREYQKMGKALAGPLIENGQSLA